MTRIAVISDVHGNIRALEAVARDLDSVKPDVLVFLGDLLISGPRPMECLELMREMAPDIWLRGNSEDLFVMVEEDPSWDSEAGRRTVAVTQWAAERVPAAAIVELAGIPIAVEKEFEERNLSFCHGGFDSNWTYLLPDGDPVQLAEELRKARGEAVICGHSHYRFQYRREGRDVVSFGSVGLPKDGGSTAARYGLIDVSPGGPVYRPRAVDYDFSAFIRDMDDSGFPEKAATLEKMNYPGTADIS